MRLPLDFGTKPIINLKNKLPKENNLETTVKRHHDLKQFYRKYEYDLEGSK